MRNIVIFSFLLLIIVANCYPQSTIEFNIASSKKLNNNSIKMKISPDGKTILFSDNSRLVLADLSLKEKWFLSFRDIYDFSFNRSGSEIILSTKDDGMVLITSETGDYLKLNNEIEKAQIVRISQSGSIYCAIKKNCIYLFNKSTNTLRQKISDAHKKEVVFAEFVSDKTLLTIGNEEVIKIWDIESGTEKQNYNFKPSKIMSCSISADKKYLVVGTYDFSIDQFSLDSAIPRQTDLVKKFKIKVFDISKMQILKEIDGINDYILKMSVSADNKFCGVLKENNAIDVWNLENGNKTKTFPEESEYSDFEFDKNGKYFLTSTNRGMLENWETQGIVVEGTRAQFVGEKFKINTPTAPIITNSHSGMTVAILDFSAKLIDPQIAESVSMLFRNRMSNYDYLNIVEREEIKKILNEQGLQQSGVTSPEKASEIGKILNAQKLIMGNVSILGSTLILSAKVIDVESAKIEGGREIECQNYALENLSELIDILLTIIVEK